MCLPSKPFNIRLETFFATRNDNDVNLDDHAAYNRINCDDYWKDFDRVDEYFIEPHGAYNDQLVPFNKPAPSTFGAVITRTIKRECGKEIIMRSVLAIETLWSINLG